MSEVELSRIEQTLADVCNASDNGGVALLEAAGFSTATLARMLREYRALRESEPPTCGRYAVPRGSRCSCPACTEYQNRRSHG